jgi:hypothetical protein
VAREEEAGHYAEEGTRKQAAAGRLMSVEGIQRVPELMGALYKIVDALEHLFPGRHFTPDGHLVGSLGEVWAAHLHGLKLDTASAETHDGTARDGRRVQVKATQGNSIGISSEPDYLLVLKLNRGAEPEEVCNGPGAIPWLQAGKLQKTGQRHLSLARLRRLMDDVDEADRIPRLRSQPAD